MSLYYRIVTNAAVCKVCKKRIESKHVHDFQVCGCENNMHVDGGHFYLKRGAVDLNTIQDVSEVEYREMTEQEAENDVIHVWYPLDER